MVAEDGLEKLPFNSIPPKVLEQVAEVYQFGAKKYYSGKWLKEPTLANDRVESATRHINKWLQGINLDHESNKNHIAHAIVQLIMTLHYINEGHEDGRIYKK